MEVKSHSFYSFDFDEQHSLLSFLWTEKTATMTDADYQAGLRDYGQTMIERRARLGLIDLRKFRHRPGEHLMSWRTSEIVPMYHKAGLEKFAYVLPEGVPAPPDDAPAKKEPGEQFLTKRFATDAAARSWLTAKS
jgi:hypothetical protein